MPIPKNTPLVAIPNILAAKIAVYNEGDVRNATGYNQVYGDYIAYRSQGIEEAGSLSGWIDRDGIASIQEVLSAFGMNARKSSLVSPVRFRDILMRIDPLTINWIASVELPLHASPVQLLNIATGESLSSQLKQIYNALWAPGSVTDSGGYVAASKTMHCLFPHISPMIDGAHTGISYYNINRATYAPPLGLHSWEEWIGEPLNGVANPSPRGAGRNAWLWPQFMAAVGVNQHIYELWQMVNKNAGVQDFIALDPTPGSTGIPRIIDKGLW